MGSETPTDKFLLRRPVPAAPNTVIAAAVATELPDSKRLSHEEKRIYTQRQIAKKGNDLDGNPVAGVSVALQAAKETIDHFSTPQHFEDVWNYVVTQVGKPDHDTTIYVAVPVKPLDARSSTNVLGTAYAATLCKKLNELAKENGYTHLHFSDEKPIVMITAVNRTFSDAVGRLVRLPLFDTSAFAPDDKVIIADDHTQSGGFLATAISAFPKDSVLGVACLTRHPLSKNLTAHKQVLEALNALPEINIVYAKLAEVGVSSNTLTDREALTIIAAMTNGQDAAQNKKFNQLLDSIGRDPHIESIEKADDSLSALLMRPPLSAREMADAMEKAIPKERKQGKG